MGFGLKLRVESMVALEVVEYMWLLNALQHSNQSLVLQSPTLRNQTFLLH